MVRAGPRAGLSRDAGAATGRPAGGGGADRAAGAARHRPSPAHRRSPAPGKLRSHIREQNWYGDGGGKVGEPAALEQVQSELAATDSCLVADLAVDGRLTAVVVTGESVHTVPLGESESVRRDLDVVAADLDMAASELAGPFAAAIRGSLDERLRVVADRIVAPVLGLWATGASCSRRRAAGRRRRGHCCRGRRPPRRRPDLGHSVGWRCACTRSGRRRVGSSRDPDVDRAIEEVTRAAAVARRDRAVRRRRGGGLGGRPGGPSRRPAPGRARPHPGDNPLFAAVDLADGPWFGYDSTCSAHSRTVVLSSCELGRASVRSVTRWSA